MTETQQETPKKNFIAYLPQQMADWEIGMAVAELANGDFTTQPVNLTYVSVDGKPLATIGGMRVTPDKSVDEVDWEGVDGLILSGGEGWWKGLEGDAVLDQVPGLLSRGAPVGAICGAVDALADKGILNGREHTGNHLDGLKTKPGYDGEATFQANPVAVDGTLVTASSNGAIPLAKSLLLLSGALSADLAEDWAAYWDDYDQSAMMRLFQKAGYMDADGNWLEQE
ncbi:DJ-1/PfpI family protein [Haematomicrobium sanguinis]|uniref:DJ-1/PfpI family protein n=1 Tax=Haematomicrobium sanguinis TaxID=479106 RepID=UPI000691E481|nr:DJ-1/PfpI family protein [Haematomicrobium sanguinis]